MKNKAEIIKSARAAMEVPGEVTFWKEVEQRMNIREPGRKKVEIEARKQRTV